MRPGLRMYIRYIDLLKVLNQLTVAFTTALMLRLLRLSVGVSIMLDEPPFSAVNVIL